MTKDTLINILSKYGLRFHVTKNKYNDRLYGITSDNKIEVIIDIKHNRYTTYYSSLTIENELIIYDIDMSITEFIKTLIKIESRLSTEVKT